MSKPELAKLFAAMVQRLTLQDVRDITKEYEACFAEQLNGTSRSQALQDDIFMATVNRAFDRAVVSDMQDVSNMIPKLEQAT
jgi:hypothetical protein